MKNKLLKLTFVVFLLFSCKSDDIPFENELENINFTCCGENPFKATNVNNLENLDDDFGIPWFITPNGDSINERFIIFGLEEYPDNNLKIYNLGNELIYEADGFRSGENLFYPQTTSQTPSEGIYRYRLIVENENTYLNEGYFCVIKNSDSKLSTSECGQGLDPAIDGN